MTMRLVSRHGNLARTPLAGTLLALAALLAAGPTDAFAQAQAGAPGATQRDAQYAADSKACDLRARQAIATAEPRTLTLTDLYGRRYEALISTIGEGRYTGLYGGRTGRDLYRYCMRELGWDDTSEQAPKPE